VKYTKHTSTFLDHIPQEHILTLVVQQTESSDNFHFITNRILVPC